jgi:hypothetical protein
VVRATGLHFTGPQPKVRPCSTPRAALLTWMLLERASEPLFAFTPGGSAGPADQRHRLARAACRADGAAPPAERRAVGQGVAEHCGAPDRVFRAVGASLLEPLCSDAPRRRPGWPAGASPFLTPLTKLAASLTSIRPQRSGMDPLEWRGIPYRVTCVVTKLVTEPPASNEQVMEQVMHYLLFGGKSK